VSIPLEFDQDIQALTTGPIHWFADWPTGDVPRSGAVVYTVWDRDGRVVYVGMCGRGTREAGATPLAGALGPWGRLSSHASGRRSGDQFCVYVHDRLVIPTLHNRLTDVAEGRLRLDHATRDYIRENLGFRWVSQQDGTAARWLERHLQRGAAPCGHPLLNGIRSAPPRV
jgi:hypothetical protein